MEKLFNLLKNMWKMSSDAINLKIRKQMGRGPVKLLNRWLMGVLNCLMKL